MQGEPGAEVCYQKRPIAGPVPGGAAVSTTEQPMGTLFGAVLDEHVGQTVAQRRERERLRARHAGFLEFNINDLEQRDRYIVHKPTGRLFAPALHNIDYATVPSEDAGAFAFYDDAGTLVFLQWPSGARTLAELEAFEAEQERERIESERVRREEAAKLPRRAVTLSDLEGRPLPTIADAARIIDERGGTIERTGDRRGARCRRLTSSPTSTWRSTWLRRTRSARSPSG